MTATIHHLKVGVTPGFPARTNVAAIYTDYLRLLLTFLSLSAPIFWEASASSSRITK